MSQNTRTPDRSRFAPSDVGTLTWIQSARRFINAECGRAVNRCAIVVGLVLLGGCGGGEQHRSPHSDANDGKTARPLVAQATQAGETVAAQGISVQSLTKIRESRLSRTEFEYVFRVTLKNSGAATAAAVVTLIEAPTGSRIVDGESGFQSVPSGLSTNDIDTVTIRVDRTQPFEIAQLKWSIDLASSGTVATVAVTPSSSVPSATVAKIVSLVSSVSSGPPGMPLLVANPGTMPGGTLIAVDADNAILLAGFAGPDTTSAQLSAESTAMELARFTVGRIPGKEGFPAFDNFIRASSAFQPVVAVVEESINQGMPPMADREVQATLSALATALLPIETAVEQVAKARRARPMAIAEERPQAKPHIPLVSLALGAQDISLLDSPFRVESQHPLAWQVRTFDYAGAPLPRIGEHQGILLEPYLLDSLKRYIYEQIRPIPQTVFPATDDGRSITIEIAQSPETMRYNLGLLLGGMAQIALDIEGTPACIAGVGKVLLGDSPLLVSILAAPTRDKIKSYLKSRAWDLGKKLVAVPFSPEIAKSCLRGFDSKKSWSYFFGPALGPWMTAIAVGVETSDKVLRAVTYTEVLVLMLSNLSFEPVRRIGVCFKAFDVIGNCAQKLKFSPNHILMAPGASFDGPKLTALDAQGNPVVVPTPLDRYVFGTSPSAADVRFTPDGVKVDATAFGDTYVQITDPATGATTEAANGQLSISVRAPRFEKPLHQIAVGESINLPFVDSTGKRFDYNGPTSFLSSSKDIVEISAQFNGSNESSPTRATSLRVEGLKAGEATVWATNIATGATFQSTIRVTGGCLTSPIGEMTRLSDLLFNSTGENLLGSYEEVSPASIVNSQCDLWVHRNYTIFLSPKGTAYSTHHDASQYGLASLYEIFSIAKDGSRIYTACQQAIGTPSVPCVLNVSSRTVNLLVRDDNLSGYGGTSSARLSGQGNRLLYPRRDSVNGSSTTSWHVIDLKSGAVTCASCLVPAPLNNSNLTALGVSDDGRQIAFSASFQPLPYSALSFEALFVNVDTGTVTRIATATGIGSGGTAFSGSGNFIASLVATNVKQTGGKTVADLQLSIIDGRLAIQRLLPLSVGVEIGGGSYFSGPVIDGVTETAYLTDGYRKKIVATALESPHLIDVANWPTVNGMQEAAAGPKAFLESTGTLWFVTSKNWLLKIR